MYKLLLRNLSSGKLKEIEFSTKEEMELYKKYHSVFHAWDRPQKWIHERFLPEEDKKYIVAEQIKNKQKFYLIRPEWNFNDVQPDRDEELAQDWAKLRIKRDILLAETDCTQLADYPLDSKAKALYRDYRQFLRNITNNYNDESIHRATVMSFEEWLEFFKK